MLAAESGSSFTNSESSSRSEARAGDAPQPPGGAHFDRFFRFFGLGLVGRNPARKSADVSAAAAAGTPRKRRAQHADADQDQPHHRQHRPVLAQPRHGPLRHSRTRNLHRLDVLKGGYGDQRRRVLDLGRRRQQVGDLGRHVLRDLPCEFRRWRPGFPASSRRRRPWSGSDLARPFRSSSPECRRRLWPILVQGRRCPFRVMIVDRR